MLIRFLSVKDAKSSSDREEVKLNSLGKFQNLPPVIGLVYNLMNQLETQREKLRENHISKYKVVVNLVPSSGQRMLDLEISHPLMISMPKKMRFEDKRITNLTFIIYFSFIFLSNQAYN